MQLHSAGYVFVTTIHTRMHSIARVVHRFTAFIHKSLTGSPLRATRHAVPGHWESVPNLIDARVHACRARVERPLKSRHAVATTDYGLRYAMPGAFA